MKNQNNTDFQTENANKIEKDIANCKDNETNSIDETKAETLVTTNENAESKTINSNDITSEESELNSLNETIVADTQNNQQVNDTKQLENQTTSQDEKLDDETTNKNCSLDKAKLDKLKNWFFGSIPFIIVAIVISLFNMGRVRQPLSYLFLSLGLLELAISNIVISKKISNTCTCKSCTHQSKSSLKYAILFGAAAIGLLGLFIYFMLK